MNTIPNGFITLKEYATLNNIKRLESLRKKCRENKVDCVKINGAYYINTAKTDKKVKVLQSKDYIEMLYSGKYLEKIKERYKKSVEVTSLIFNQIDNQIDFNKKINKDFGYNFITKFEKIVNQNEDYKNCIENAKEREKKYNTTLTEYKEIEDFINSNNIKKLKLSTTSSSVYLTLENNNFINLINSLSKLNFKITNDISNKKNIIVRFSDHLPCFCKKNKEIDSHKKQNYDILVFYSNCNEQVTVK